MNNFRTLYRERLLAITEVEDFIILNKLKSNYQDLIGLSAENFYIWLKNPDSLLFLIAKEENNDILGKTIANKGGSQSVA